MITGTLHPETVERFLYWIKERHTIHLKREAGYPKPWTQDKLLRDWFFTNPYRENDKVTRWFRDNIRNRMSHDPHVGFTTVAFRWFNYIPTGYYLVTGNHPRRCEQVLSAALSNLAASETNPPARPTGKPKLSTKAPKKLQAAFDKLQDTMSRPDKTALELGAYTISPKEFATADNLFIKWNPKLVRERLLDLTKDGSKFITGAYIIKTYNGISKIEGLIKAIDNVWRDRHNLERELQAAHTLKRVWEKLCGYQFLGKFMAYEIVSDLRHTSFLQNAEDIMTWANLGPGAIRGLHRMCNVPVPKNKGQNNLNNCESLMDQLIHTANSKLVAGPKVINTTPATLPQALKSKAGVILPLLEMREIEHSLCEFDKYERARQGVGQMKRTYDGNW